MMVFQEIIVTTLLVSGGDDYLYGAYYGDDNITGGDGEDCASFRSW